MLQLHCSVSRATLERLQLSHFPSNMCLLSAAQCSAGVTLLLDPSDMLLGVQVAILVMGSCCFSPVSLEDMSGVATGGINGNVGLRCGHLESLVQG